MSSVCIQSHLPVQLRDKWRSGSKSVGNYMLPTLRKILKMSYKRNKSDR